MRVALDVSIQSHAEPTGVERAQATLLEGLLALPDAPELHLLGAAPSWDAPDAAVTVHRGGGGALWRQTTLPSLLRSLEADVFHGPVAAVPAVAPCPVVASLHDLPWAEQEGPRGDDEGPLRHRVATALAVRVAAALLVPSRRTADQLLRLHPDAAARVHVVPHGLGRLPTGDDGARAALACLGVPAAGAYLLALGRRRPRKNLTALVAAFARAPGDAVPDVLVLAGPPGAADDDLRRAAAAPDLARAGRRVVFPGYVARDGLSTLIAGARALVSPSLFEGYGLPALEAMALGTPVLTARQGVVDEVAQGAALRVDGRSVDVLAAGLAMICGDEALRAELVAAGHARAAERSATAMAASTRAIYEAVA